MPNEKVNRQTWGDSEWHEWVHRAPPQHVSSSPDSRTVGKEVLLTAWQSGKKAKEVRIHSWISMPAFLLSFMTFKMRFVIIITPSECGNAHFMWHCCASYQDQLCDFAIVVQPLSHVQFCASPRMHTRLLCPSPSPRACSNSCSLSQWCHPTISSSVIPFSSCPQSFPALGSFPMSQLFTSGGQSVGASASASVLPMNIQG